jgi:hypothetical protein
VDQQLWGTFSVADHLRPRAFVADVLLYDRLVIPVPPEEDAAERKRWRSRRWRPARQHDLIETLPREQLIKVPWTRMHREQWERDHEEQQQLAGINARSDLAKAAAADMVDVARARAQAPSIDADEYDTIGQFVTRRVLHNLADARADRAVYGTLPRAQVETVVAYGSYESFAKNATTAAPTTADDPGLSLQVFGWEFLVPSSSHRTDTDLLREAVELAQMDETVRYRRAFHRWRRQKLLEGEEPSEARKELVDAMRQYGDRMRRVKVYTTARYGFLAVTAAAATGAVFVPPIGAVATVTGPGQFIVERRLDKLCAAGNTEFGSQES